ncbi:MAG: hypothetical protein D6813_05545 [Calditrichaeota bacterium]|nr:MAG: hypothetical protein D6813_05545 [Calditrichota bacterium]
MNSGNVILEVEGGREGEKFGQIIADMLGAKTILYQGAVTPFGGSGSWFDKHFERKIFLPRQNNHETNQ